MQLADGLIVASVSTIVRHSVYALDASLIERELLLALGSFLSDTAGSLIKENAAVSVFWLFPPQITNIPRNQLHRNVARHMLISSFMNGTDHCLWTCKA